jgi:hypothetical protein
LGGQQRRFAQADEVLIDQRLTQGGGFSPQSTAVTSANQLDRIARATDAALSREWIEN